MAIYNQPIEYDIDNLESSVKNALDQRDIVGATFYFKIEPILSLLSKFEFSMDTNNYNAIKSNTPSNILDKFFKQEYEAQQYWIQSSPIMFFKNKNNDYFFFKDTPKTLAVDYSSLYNYDEKPMLHVHIEDNKAYIVQASSNITDDFFKEIEYALNNQYGTMLTQELQQIHMMTRTTQKFVTELDIKRFKIDKL